MENESLKNVDPEVFDAILKEQEREHEKIVLIASENYTGGPRGTGVDLHEQVCRRVSVQAVLRRLRIC
jgi:hypothetical protein